MAKILSQSEIEALLTGASTDNAEAVSLAKNNRNVQVYDFKHPNRISKDQIRTLESIHTTFAGKFASALSGMLRSVVDVDVQSVDQLTYSEFIGSLSTPSCTYTFHMNPLEGQCVADFSPVLTFAFVDRVFGGRGQAIEADREMTGIEASVMDRVAKRVYRNLAEAWSRVVEVEVTQQSVETTPQFIQIVPPGETVIVVALQLKLMEVTGVVTFCYPFIMLEPVFTSTVGQNWYEASKPKATENDRKNVASSLDKVSAFVRAELATTDIRMRDFLDIKVGDVLLTETDAVAETRVYVGDALKFTARPGIRGRRNAVEILSSLPGE